MVMVSHDDQEQCLSWLCLSDRYVGNLLKGQTVGVIGAGRIGSAYARMMVILYLT
jgi:phosphoglycerate dehydrogenase-like enzyme